MNFWRCADATWAIARSRVPVFGGLIAFSLLLGATSSQAQQIQSPRTRGNSIPTLEALPHDPLPPGRFIQWCGDRIVTESDEVYEIYQGGVSSPLLSVSRKSQLECGQDGDKLVRIDEVGGLIYEVDVPSGVTKRALARFDRNLAQDISFSPDMKSVASRQPLTLESSTVTLNVLPLSGSKDREIGRVGWMRDSSAFFGISASQEKVGAALVQIFNEQGQTMGSGALPPGSLFRNGWFAKSRTLYLELGSVRDEFGAGEILECRIQGWKCEKIASNVLEASAGGDGILGIVRAIGKFSSNGDVTTYPPGYLVEIRNGDGKVMARQTFTSRERVAINLTLAPSGKKAILSWYGKAGLKCPAEKQSNYSCENGMMIDLSGMPE